MSLTAGETAAAEADVIEERGCLVVLRFEALVRFDLMKNRARRLSPCLSVGVLPEAIKRSRSLDLIFAAPP
jgi:hypothetical protein